MAERNEARRVGRYLLADRIGSGGMATVHIGRLLGAGGFSRIVAIKRLRQQFVESSELVSTILDEARLASRIHDPHVVPVLDFLEEDGELFLVMEYVVGETLHRLIQARGPSGERMPPRIAIGILAGALHGLHAAHEAKSETGEPLGLVHRDVSPQNIMVGVDGLARVVDFGVAKARGRLQTTREGQVKGKLAHMAPEQIQAGDVTRKADIFAAAGVLWEALTGRRLFQGDSDGTVLNAVLHASIEAPSALAKEVPAPLDALVLRGLERDPARRFATALEFAAALEREAEIASPTEIGTWVAEAAKPMLAVRAGYVAALERSSPARVRAPHAAPEAPAPLGDSTAITALDAQPRSTTAAALPLTPRPWLWPLLVAAPALLGAAALFASRAAPTAPVVASASATASASGSAEVLPPPAADRADAARIVLVIDSAPPGASVTLSGERRGTTPLTLELERNDTPVVVELGLAGFKTWSARVPRSVDQQLKIALEPGASKAPLPRSTAAAPPRIRRFD